MSEHLEPASEFEAVTYMLARGFRVFPTHFAVEFYSERDKMELDECVMKYLERLGWCRR